MSKTIMIKDWYGNSIRGMTYDESQKQLTGVKVPEEVPGVFTFYFSDHTSVDLLLRYYVKGYAGGGDQQGFLRVVYPKGQTTFLPDLTRDFDIYIMTTNPSPNHISLKVDSDLWHVYYTGAIQKIMITSGTNPDVHVETNNMTLDFRLPINNKYTVWGMSDTSTTQPDVYANELTAVSYTSGTHVNVIFTSVPTDAIFMKLYQNTAGSTVVDKTSFLTEVDTVPGVLRKQCSVSDPVITIKYDGKPAANYCQIEEFKRYYYINDIVNIAKDLWELYLKSDPLFSFKDEYLNSLVTILRSSSSSIYNRLYHDNLMPIPNKLTRTRTYSTGSPLYPGFLTGVDHIVLTTFSDPDVQPNIPQSKVNPQQGLNRFAEYYPRGAQAFLLSTTDLNFLAKIFANGGPKVSGITLDNIFGTDDLTPYIMSIRAYPINFQNLMDDVTFREYTIGTQTNVPMEVPCGKMFLERDFGTAQTPDICKVMGRPLVPVYPALNFGTITIPTPVSFLDTEPNTRAILHLPYIGDIDFDLVEYAGVTIKIEYLIDVSTGNIKALIRNNSDQSILFTQSGKMGVDIPMILNNMTKGDNERTGQAIKLGTTIATITAGAVGTAAGSPIAGGLIGGAVGLMGNTIATPFFNTPAQNKQFAAGDLTEFMTDQRVYIEMIKPEDNFNIFYAREYGVPANKIINLSDNTVSGFTVVSPNSRITHPVEATLNEYDEICSALKSGVVI